MKVAILVAGGSLYFPLFIDKPKSLYHFNGKIQLQRVIEDVKTFVEEKDIIVVAGYKSNYIKDFLNEYYPKITLKINNLYNKSAIYSFRAAIENENEDIVIMFGDESISKKNIEKIIRSKRKLSLLCHDTYYYYSLGIMKIRNDVLDLIYDDKYLSMDAMKEIYCFANNKTIYDGTFNINSGICIGYIMIDFIRQVGKIKKISNPIETYTGDDIDFIHYNPEDEYIPDLDNFKETDEYKNNLYLRLYNDIFSNGIKTMRKIPKKLIKIWRNICNQK